MITFKILYLPRQPLFGGDGWGEGGETPNYVKVYYRLLHHVQNRVWQL